MTWTTPPIAVVVCLSALTLFSCLDTVLTNTDTDITDPIADCQADATQYCVGNNQQALEWIAHNVSFDISSFSHWNPTDFNPNADYQFTPLPNSIKQGVAESD